MNDLKKDPWQFEEALKAWGSRPPGTPAGEAARAVRKVLPDRRRSLPYLRPALALAAVILVVLGLSLLAPGLRQGRHTSVATVLPPPVDESVVVWWLDDDTPVYFVTQGNGNGSGGGS